MSYVLRHRIFRGQDVYIVVSTGTPTPIVAICNYLMLALPTAYDPKLTPSEKRDGKILSREDLLNLWVQVSTFALSSLDSTDELVLNSFTKGELLFEDSGLKPNHVGSTLDFLSDDISPDLKTSTFILSLCKELNISLHHGWLVNLEPQSAALRGAFTSVAPNELQVHAMNAFKSGSVDQLTGYGRASLNNDISEGAFALLFRKNNLSVLCKYHGRLFELETDNDIWNVVNGAMWKTLCLSVSQEVFLASDFSCTDMQPNSEVASVVEFIKQWKRSEEEIKKADDDKLFAMFDSSEKKKSGKVRKKNKKTAGEGIPGSEGESSVNQSGAKTADSTPIVHTAVVDGVEWIQSSFMQFLNGFIDEDDDFPEGVTNKHFYVRRLNDLMYVPKSQRSLRMVVNYLHIERFDPTLAVAILNNLTRLHDILREELVKFCEEHDYRPRIQLKRLRLLIDNLPPAECIPESFLDFLKSKNIKLSQLHTLFNGKTFETVVRTSYIGRIAGKGYFDYILDRHNDEESWNGEFGLEDMAVKNGKFVILKPATVKACKESIYNDWKGITEQLFPLYKIDKTAPSCLSYIDYILEHRIDCKGYIDSLLEQHHNGFSWNGKFDLNDMAVRDGRPLIVKPATMVADSDSKYQDFKNLILKLFPDYVIDEAAPSYLHIIQKELLAKMNFYDTDPPRFRTFQRFLSNNLAWKSPLVISSLTQNVHKVCNSLRLMQPGGKRVAPYMLQAVLSDEDSNWQSVACITWGFDGVYKFDNPTDAKFVFTTFFCFLEYIRHSDTHVLDFTRDMLGRQLIDDIEYVFLMIGKIFEEEMSALLFEMMHELTTPPFDSSWRLFENSECGDVPENTASTSGTANDAQSAGYENASPGIIGPDTDNVQSAGNGSGAASAAGKDGNERVLSYGDVMLLRSDLTILRGPHFLNDRIIAFYLAYLSLAFEVKDDDDADLVLLPPSISYLLSNLPEPDSVAIIAEPIRLASRRLVLLPVNDNPDASLADGGSHWTLLVLDATAGASRPRFVHHDSLGIINDQAVHGLAAALRPLLPASDNGVPLVEGPTPKQINGHDCGVYILAVAKAICNWWRDSRGQQQEGGTDWFDTVRKEVNAESVKAMRTEMLHLISRLIQEKEEEKKNKAMEVGKEH